MSRVISLSLLIVIALGVLLASSLSPQASQVLPDAPSGPVTALSAATGGPGVTDPLFPPPKGLTPPVGSEDAFATAWETEPPFGYKYESAHAVLTVHGVPPTPMWIVVFKGGCLLVHGPGVGRSEDEPTTVCGPDIRWAVNVDALTGEVPAAFGYQYDPTNPDMRSIDRDGA